MCLSFGESHSSTTVPQSWHTSRQWPFSMHVDALSQIAFVFSCGHVAGSTAPVSAACTVTGAKAEPKAGTKENAMVATNAPVTILLTVLLNLFLIVISPFYFVFVSYFVLNFC